MYCVCVCVYVCVLCVCVVSVCVWLCVYVCVLCLCVLCVWVCVYVCVCVCGTVFNNKYFSSQFLPHIPHSQPSLITHSNITHTNRLIVTNARYARVRCVGRMLPCSVLQHVYCASDVQCFVFFPKKKNFQCDV